jgi:hypothetical protein
MAQPPYRLRVIDNYSEQQKVFTTQPYPFSLIELIQGYKDKVRVSFTLALWSLYEVTKDENDKNLAQVLKLDISYLVKDAESYATYLDPRKLPLIQDFRHYLYLPNLMAKFEGVKIINREELFSYYVKYRLMNYIRYILDKKEINRKNIKDKFDNLFKNFLDYEKGFIREYLGIEIVEHKYKFDTGFMPNYKLFVVPPKPKDM